MPVLKHAKKKLRQDKNRTLKNKKVREFYKSSLKKAKTSPTDKNVSEAFSALDKAVKLNIIHANKAARLKSSLTKGAGGTQEKKGEAKKEATKPVEKKAPAAKTTKKATVKKKSTKKSSK